MPTFTRFIAVLVVMFAAVCLMSFGSALAASDEFVWSEPGVDPFKGDIEKAIGRFAGIPPTAKAKLVAKVKKSIVGADVLKKYILASSMSGEEKAKAQKLIEGHPFFNIERLARLGLPQALLAEIVTKETDASGYTVGEIAPGQKCDWMAFGRDSKVVPRVVYKPAAKVREPKLKAHFFTEEDAGVKYTVAQPLVCDNLCFWRAEVGLVRSFEAPARQAALRAVAAPRPQLGYKHIIQWLWLPHELTNQLGLSNVRKRTHGKNSRSLGWSFFVDGDSSRPIPPRYEKGDVAVEFIFRDVNYVSARGRTVLVNGIPALIPADFSAEKPGLQVPATRGGTAALSLGPDGTEWATPQIVVETSFELFRDRVSYPDPARTLTKRAMLATCAKGASELTRCGRPWTNDASEIYRWLQKEGDDEFRMHMRMK